MDEIISCVAGNEFENKINLYFNEEIEAVKRLKEEMDIVKEALDEINSNEVMIVKDETDDIISEIITSEDGTDQNAVKISSQVQEMDRCESDKNSSPTQTIYFRLKKNEKLTHKKLVMIVKKETDNIKSKIVSSEDGTDQNAVKISTQIQERDRFESDKKSSRTQTIYVRLKRNEKLTHTKPVDVSLKKFDCLNELKTNNDLGRHLQDHSSDVHCFDCGKTFKKHGDLTRHMQMHSGKFFKCDECGTLFTYKENLAKHRITHSKSYLPTKFKCKICNAIFKSKSTLNQHMLIHSGVKNFKCEECGKSFFQKVSLRNHLKVHIGEKNFKCNECGKLFNLKGNLAKHLLIHTGEKNFKCSVCGKAFNQKVSLNRHMGIHSKIYQCAADECGFVFKDENSFLEHIKTHPGGTNLAKCEICGIICSKYTLKQHLRRRSHSERPQNFTCGV